MASDIMELSEIQTDNWILNFIVRHLDIVHEVVERSYIQSSIIYPLYLKLEAETSAFYYKQVVMKNSWIVIGNRKLQLQVEDFLEALRLIDELAKTVKMVSHPLALLALDFITKECKENPLGRRVKEAFEKIKPNWRRSLNKEQVRVYNVLKNACKAKNDLKFLSLLFFNPPRVDIKSILPTCCLYSTMKSVRYLTKLLKENSRHLLQKLEDSPNFQRSAQKKAKYSITNIWKKIDKVYNEYVEYFVHFPIDIPMSLIRLYQEIPVIKAEKIFLTPVLCAPLKPIIKDMCPARASCKIPKACALRSLISVYKPESEKKCELFFSAIPSKIIVNLLYTQCITSSKFYFATGLLECPLVPSSGCPIKQTDDPKRILHCINSSNYRFLGCPRPLDDKTPRLLRSSMIIFSL